jgi:hypothetical protein
MLRPLDGPDPSSMAEAWLGATRWWADALVAGPQAWPDANGKLLAEFADSAARRFRGRRIEFDIGGRRVRATLESIRLDRRDNRYGARLQLRDVDWDGLLFDRLSIVAAAVTLSPPPTVALTAFGVELEGLSSLASLVAWLDRRMPQWELGVGQRGLIEATRASSQRRLLLEPVVLDGALEVELRGVGWRSLWLRLPAWLRLTRNLALPTLPEGISVAEARRRGASVDLRLSVPAVSRRLDSGFLLDALSPDRPEGE